ncbi:MAG: HAMP domain-containing histidine kinase [Oscillospiraceae bacterium]|nr:HAMP domain-containing histidine kinase [Oscillospiraceae bacterium]
MAVKKITQRWLYNSFLVILVILCSFVVVFSFGLRGYYYNSVSHAVKQRAGANETLLLTYSQDSTIDLPLQIRHMVEDFSDKDKIEMMAIDNQGRVFITSSGFEPDASLEMPDYKLARESSNGIGEFRGNVSGEEIYAVTYLSPVNSDELSAFRYVTSLSKVNHQIMFFIILIISIGIAIIFFVIMSSSYFISSIVNPVSSIGETARRIAQGDLKARLTKTHDDELGDLCDIINHMAEELQTTENMKNEFISSVSHELRTPLAAIKGWGETILSDKEMDRETMDKGMQVIIKETQRLSSMVEELLDFSRLQSGNLKMNMGKLDIVAEIEDVVLMYTERAKRENIQLIWNETDSFFIVYGDVNRLRQVLVNIIDNAIKYSDSGDTVTVSIAQQDENILITIRDTGIGISAVDLPQVKNKFYKANSTRRGSGIGLAVADEIIAMHGGSLSLDSIQGEGTTVTITLPLYKEKKNQQ